MLPKNIQSQVVEQVITLIQKENSEFVEQQHILSLFVDKCVNFDIKCKKFIQKTNIINTDTDETLSLSLNRLDTSPYEIMCDFCGLKICQFCVNYKDAPDTNTLSHLNLYDLCDLCYKQLCSKCISKFMMFCYECGIACVCNLCIEQSALLWQGENYGRWTCDYCKLHPRRPEPHPL